MDRYIIGLICIVAGIGGLYILLKENRMVGILYTKWEDLFGEKGTKIIFMIIYVISILVGCILLFYPKK